MGRTTESSRVYGRCIKAAATALMISTAIATSIVAFAEMASAQSAGQRNYSIPPGPLSQALAAFGSQSGLQVSYPSELTTGKQSPGISATATPQQALSRILSGSGLSYSFLNTGTVAISRPGTNGAAATVDGAIALDTIDVSGGGLQSELADAPYRTPGSTNYITTETIERFRGTSTGDLLKAAPGVISGMNRNGAAVDVNIRGLQGMGRVATTVDGSQQATSTWRGYKGVDNRTYVDPDLISGVSVTKGPNGEAGSSGAIGGVVAMETLNVDDVLKSGKTYGIRLKGTLVDNTITPEINRTIERTSASSLFDFDSGSGSAAAAVRQENFDLLAAISKRKAGNYFAGSDGPLTFNDHRNRPQPVSPSKHGEEVFNTSEDMVSALVKGTVRMDDGHTLKLGYMHYENTFGEVLPTLLWNGLTGRQVPLSQIAVDTATARHTWKPVGNDLIDMKANAWYSNADEDTIFTDALGSHGRYVRSINYGIDLANASRFQTAIGAATLRYGTAYSMEDAKPTRESSNPNFVRPIDGTRQIFSVFLNGELRPVNWLAVEAGAKYQSYDVEYRGTVGPPKYLPNWPQYEPYKGDNISPNFAVTVTPYDGWQLFGKYVNGYRPPSLRESTFNSSEFIFNPNLRPEEAHNWEFGTNYLTQNLLGADDKLKLKLAYFHNTYDDYMARSYNASWQLAIMNIQKVRMQGVELSGRYDLSSTFVDFAMNYYTKVEFCETSATCTDQTSQTDYLANHVPPKFTASATIGQWFFDRKLLLGTRISYVSARAGSLGPDMMADFFGLLTTPWQPYTLVDAFAQWKVSEEATLDVNVDNVFDRYYMDALNNTNMPSPGRTIRSSLTLKF